ncbi:MAG TPA: hypothetical protein VGA00_12235 [Acidiferrobacterales bacterium]
MNNRIPRQALKAAALLIALALAPAAQAGSNEVSRDTGVGQHIAAQGNQAIHSIRAEFKAAARALTPKLPSAARVVKISQPAGATVAAGAGVRCDQ